jgi:transposase
VLQYLEKLPDRQASGQVVKRLDWKYALRQELTWKGFHYSDLCNFRKRLLAHDARGVVCEKVLEFLKAKGWLKAKGKQRTDATHIIGQVQRLSVFELKWESLRIALSDVLGREVPPSISNDSWLHSNFYFTFFAAYTLRFSTESHRSSPT